MKDQMHNPVITHYGDDETLADMIAGALKESGKSLAQLTTRDLATFDEFHIRGRGATLELATRMNLSMDSHVLDIGSGLGGPARCLAEVYGCRVTGIDLTPAFCHAATTLSGWTGLSDRVDFEQGDATRLSFGEDQFDAAMTIHVAMNIKARDRVYAEAKRVIRPDGIFAIYDVLQGEGGDVLYPVPWARDSHISHLATTDQMTALLADAGFKLLEVTDSTEQNQSWFERMASKTAARIGSSAGSSAPPESFQVILGDDYPEMVKNQVRNLCERRIRTVSFICRV